MVLSTGTKGPVYVVKPGGLFSPVGKWTLVPGAKPGLKERPFSPGFVLPVPKPGLKGVTNRE